MKRAKRKRKRLIHADADNEIGNTLQRTNESQNRNKLLKYKR